MSDDPRRARLRIAYDGAAYHGWQQQPDVPTVQGTLRAALERWLGDPSALEALDGASRTDAGVHALGQTASIAFRAERDLWGLVRGANALTPDDICVTRAEWSPEGFHARHSSGGKTYRYELWNHRFGHPLDRGRRWHVRHPLDVERMSRAARLLVGEHDFAAFRASDCQAATTRRRIRDVRVVGSGAALGIWVRGDAFLKYMVRIIAGTLVEIGRGRLEPAIIGEMLASGGDRSMGGPTAPAHGLTLIAVHYPDFPWRAGEPELGGVPWA